MPAAVYGHDLINYDSEGATAPAEVLGPKWQVLWGVVPDFASLVVSGLLKVTQAGGTLPTTAAFIRLSSDNVNWYETSLDVNLGPTDTERVLTGGPQGWNYAQVRLAIGGTVRPSVTAWVAMTATSPFTLVEVA